MMNPQFMPPGQNNNAPNNPIGFPPSSQDFNGHQNANIYAPMPSNGPPPQMMPPMKPVEQPDVMQKLQGLNLNGPPGFPGIPSSQIPVGQLPPGAMPPSNLNPGSQTNQLPQGFHPSSGTPTGNINQQFPSSQTLPEIPHSRPFMPPSLGPPSMASSQLNQPPSSTSQGPPNSQPSHISTTMGNTGQLPPHNMPQQSAQGLLQFGQEPYQLGHSQPQPSHGPPQLNHGQRQPGQGPPLANQGPPQHGQGPPQLSHGPPQPGNGPPQPGQGPPLPGHGSLQSGHGPPQPGQGPPQPRQGLLQPGQGPPQPGQGPPQPGQGPPQPGQGPPQPGQGPPQPGQGPPQPGQGPPQPGQGPPQPGQGPPQTRQGLLQPRQGPPQPGQGPPQPGHGPPQPGQGPPQPGQGPPQPGHGPPQPGQGPPQPGHGPPLGQTSHPPGMPQQNFQQPQPQQVHNQGFPPQPSQGPMQPGQMMKPPGLPPQPGQMPGGPQSQVAQQFPGQRPPPGPDMPGLPHMPPPLTQHTRQFQGVPPANQQSGVGIPPGVPTFPGMPPTSQPPMPGQQFPGHPPMPGQPPYSAQSQMPGQPPMPAQQSFPGQPPMPGQPPLPGHPSMPGHMSMPGQQLPPQPNSGYPPQQYQNQPPFPGQQPSYPPQQYPGYQQPQQPMKKLDPDQMPSPIQVMADDQQNRGGIFVTNDRGLVPPLVTTDFIVDDKGNASPRYIRSSMYSVPVNPDMLKQTAFPLCLVISPMAETVGTEQEPPLLDFAALTNSPTMGPVRCTRCKAYMCPSMKFIDAGRHFKCPFCKATTEVPMEYTQYVNSMQQYGRMPAEMALGTYEIVATKEYCRNNTLPNPPALVFVIDVSYNAVKCGLVHTVCQNIMHIIESIPKDSAGVSHTRVGFITYSSTVHFYNIKGSLAQPQLLSVGDVSDMFVPLLEGFLVRPEDSGPVLQVLLQQLPLMFSDNKETEIILLPAVQAGLEALKAAETSGQLLVFHTSLPTFLAPGKLNNREDRKLLGTEKEKQILSPQTTAYNELAQSCSAAGVCVEMFVANNSYVDAATIGQLPRLTGGQLHKYTYFQAEIDGTRLIEDVIRVVTRPTAFDAVLRVRTSTGVRATDFYGHFFMSNTTDVELAAIDADKAIGVEIKHDDKLTAEDGVYIQTALLYTHRSGQRRLRVLNLALDVAHQLADVFRSCDLDTLINFLTKQAVWALRDTPPRAVREGLSARCARSLLAYRRHCASPSSAGQLVLPESCKLLPLYTNCILRSDAIAGGPDLTCDDRSCAMYRALTADVSTSVVLTYPRLLPLHLLPDPLPQLRASIDKMSDQGVYLLENGVHMLLWVGSQAHPEFLQEVFGCQSPQQIDTQVAELPELDTEMNEAVRRCVSDARYRRRKYMRLTIMRQHDKLETVLRHFLVEDRGVDGSAAYVDFLCHIHKEIRALL